VARRNACIKVCTDANDSQSLNTSSLVTLDPPSALSPRVLNALKADPRTVDLRALAPHFYDLGARILELFEEEEMIEVLGDVSQSGIY
jgi:GINS complex subunit 3